MFEFTLCLLAVWRLTHLLNREDGPWSLVLGLRRLVGNGFFGQLLDCFYCLSIWIAVPFAIYLTREVWPVLLYTLALSAGAILIERLTNPGFETADHAVYYEEDPP